MEVVVDKVEVLGEEDGWDEHSADWLVDGIDDSDDCLMALDDWKDWCE